MDVNTASANRWRVRALLVAAIAGILVAAMAAPAEAAAGKRRVAMAISDRSITVGESIRISGRVAPATGGGSVTLQKKIGGRWKTEKRIALSRTGAFTYVDRPSTAQSRRYRVTVPARSGFARSTSRTLNVRVTKPRARDLVGAEIMSAWVPSLAGNPAGHLRGGKLPGYAYPRVFVKKYVFGDLDGAGGRDAAVVVQANGGGVGWPDVVLLYTADKQGKPRYRGKFAQGINSRNGTRSLSLVARTVDLAWSDGEAWECGACGTLDAGARLVLKRGVPVVISRWRYGAEEAFSAFLSAVNRQDVRLMRSLGADTAMVNAATQAVHQGGSLTPERYFGEGRRTACDQEFDDASSQCMASNRAVAMTAGLHKVGWRRWKVDYFYGESY